MNMLACHCTDFREVITYILLANDTNSLNTWWDLVRVFSTWYYATTNVPYEPIIRYSLPREIVVAIVVAVMVIVVVVVVHDQKRFVRIVQFGIKSMYFQTIALLLFTSTFVFEADVLVLYFCSLPL